MARRWRYVTNVLGGLAWVVYDVLIHRHSTYHRKDS